MPDQPLLVERKNFWMLRREPQRRRRCRSRENNFDIGLRQQIHHAPHPVEFEAAFFWLVKPPREFAETHDVHAEVHHEFHVARPLRFGIVGSACVREDPVFWMVVDAKIHTTIGLFARESSGVSLRGNAETEQLALARNRGSAGFPPQELDSISLGTMTNIFAATRYTHAAQKPARAR